jgi:hypothetical protein
MINTFLPHFVHIQLQSIYSKNALQHGDMIAFILVISMNKKIARHMINDSFIGFMIQL